MTVLQLRDGLYAQVAHVRAGQSERVELPFPMVLTPAELVG